MPWVQSEEQLFEAPHEEVANLPALQRFRRHGAHTRQRRSTPQAAAAVRCSATAPPDLHNLHERGGSFLPPPAHPTRLSCPPHTTHPCTLRSLPAVGSVLRLTWLLCLFAPLALAAPLVGDLLGISRARWLRLLRCVLIPGSSCRLCWASPRALAAPGQLLSLSAHDYCGHGQRAAAGCAVGTPQQLGGFAAEC